MYIHCKHECFYYIFSFTLFYIVTWVCFSPQNHSTYHYKLILSITHKFSFYAKFVHCSVTWSVVILENHYAITTHSGFPVLLTKVRNTEEQLIRLLLSSFLPSYVLELESSAAGRRGASGCARAAAWR